MLTRTWFHGAFFEAGKVSQRYAHEYWPGASAMVPDGVLDASLTAEETREAYRVLKGSALRVEVYGADGTERAKSPYKVTEHNFHVRRLQPFGPNQHAVFMTHARESVTRQYERQQDDPRIAHEFTVEVDAFGNVLRSASVAYGRRPPAPSPEPKLSQAFRDMLSYDQSRLHISASQHVFAKSMNSPTDLKAPSGRDIDSYRAPPPAETITAELTGATPEAGARLFTFTRIDNLLRPASQAVDAGYTSCWDGSHDVAYEDTPPADIDGAGNLEVGRRIVEHSRRLTEKTI